jgi:hypothetical protein
MSGAAVAGQCFTDLNLAAAVACSNFSSVTSSGTLQCSAVTPVSGGQTIMSMVSWPVGSPTGTTYSQTYNFPSCDPVTVTDGVVIGLAIGTVWISIAALLYIRKVLT